MSENLTLEKILEYEILSSFWAKFIFWEWGQDLVSEYYLQKAMRKFNRYLSVKGNKCQN